MVYCGKKIFELGKNVERVTCAEIAYHESHHVIDSNLSIIITRLLICTTSSEFQLFMRSKVSAENSETRIHNKYLWKRSLNYVHDNKHLTFTKLQLQRQVDRNACNRRKL